MPGFIAHIGKEKFSFAEETRKKLVVNHIDGNGYQLERRVVDKFMNHKIYFDWILDKYPNGQMGDDMKHLFEDCVLYDKLQALSVLGAIKQLYK